MIVLRLGFAWQAIWFDMENPAFHTHNFELCRNHGIGPGLWDAQTIGPASSMGMLEA
jgi:hypothetical protein